MVPKSMFEHFFLCIFLGYGREVSIKKLPLYAGAYKGSPNYNSYTINDND